MTTLQRVKVQSSVEYVNVLRKTNNTDGYAKFSELSSKRISKSYKDYGCSLSC